MQIPRIILPVVSAAIIATVLWFYHWTAGAPWFFAGVQADYYNLLVDGFQEGSLAMKATPDPWLGVDNTKAAHYLLDASLYNGKYYLYFGATPALLLFWPWTAFTGHDLPVAAATVVLAGLAYLVSVGWLATLRRRFFPELPVGYWLLAVVLLGLATGYPVVLRRPLFYEVAIFAGTACSFGGLWCLTLALLRPQQAGRWLAAGSLCAGLAAGSRPTLIPGALLAVALGAGWLIWQNRATLKGRGITGLLAAAVLPAGLCGAVVAWYNWARFGSPLEFGLNHQLGSNGFGFSFRWQHLVDNLGLYYFKPPDMGWFFPFFAPTPKPPGPAQEQVHGQFFFLACFFAVGVWAVCNGFRKLPRGLAVVIVMGVAWAGVTMVFVGMAWSHSNRYMLDFHPVMVALVLPALWACSREGGRWRRAAGLAVAGSGWLVIFGICTSMHVHGFFQEAHPETYARLARLADRIVWPLHRLAGSRLGGLEIAVRFPAGNPGAIEPLLVAGAGSDWDGITVQYTTPGRARLAFIHLRYGEIVGPEFDLQPGRLRWMRIHLGTLYPPPWHPWYQTQPPGMARARNRVAVTLDGETVLEQDAVTFTASMNQMHLGRRAGFPLGAERFEGTVQRVRGLGGDQEWLQGLQAEAKAVRLTVLLPRDRFGAEEPLWMSGERGREDFLSVTYVREGVVRFTLRHPGWPQPRHSAEIAWEYTQPLELLLNLGSPAGEFQLEMDGQIVLAERLAGIPADQLHTYLGCVPWPVGRSRLMFGGVILEQARIQEAVPPEIRARGNLLAGRMVHLEFRLPDAAGLSSQPLLTTGIVGRGDGLFLEEVGPGRFVIGLDHWGSQPLRSAPVALAPGRWHRLKVSFGTKLNRHLTVPGRLRVEVDGAVVLDADADFFPAEPALVFFGANPIGMSTSVPAFTGELRILEDRPAEGPPTASP